MELSSNLPLVSINGLLMVIRLLQQANNGKYRNMNK